MRTGIAVLRGEWLWPELVTTGTFPWTVSTTQVYTHVNPTALRAKIQGKHKRQEQIAELQQQLAGLQEQIAARAAEQ